MTERTGFCVKIGISGIYDLDRLRAAIWAAIDELERQGVTHADRIAVFIEPFAGSDASTIMPVRPPDFTIGSRGEVTINKPALPRARK